MRINSCSGSQEIIRFCGTRNFITMFTRDRHWILCWVGWIHSTPTYSIYLGSTLILSSNLRRDISSGLLSSGFLNKILYHYSFPCVIYILLVSSYFYSMTITTTTTTVEKYNYDAPNYIYIFRLLLTPSFLGPNILLSTLFSKSHTLYSSLSLRDQVSHPYKITVLYSLIFRRWEELVMLVFQVLHSFCWYQKGLQIKVKIKLSLCLTKHHVRNTYEGGCIAPRIINPSTRWMWVVSFTNQPPYPQRKSPSPSARNRTPIVQPIA
jgi:hypothetical protein